MVKVMMEENSLQGSVFYLVDVVVMNNEIEAQATALADDVVFG